MPRHKFKKGDKKPPNSGRKQGVQNRRTVFIQTMLEDAVVRMGGLERLVQWAKKNPGNEHAFWTQLVPRLIPIQLQGSGKDGALVIRVTREELAQKLVERGLAPTLYGVEVPKLEDMRVINGNGEDKDDNGNGSNGDARDD
jgi:hypothetical protein